MSIYKIKIDSFIGKLNYWFKEGKLNKGRRVIQA